MWGTEVSKTQTAKSQLITPWEAVSLPEEEGKGHFHHHDLYLSFSLWISGKNPEIVLKF